MRESTEKKQARCSLGRRSHHEKGCIACHSTDGSPEGGPSFKGIFGKKQTVLHDGKEQEALVDEKFIREKLLHPEINRIKGFPPIMPSQQGQLTEAEIDAVIHYHEGAEMKSVRLYKSSSPFSGLPIALFAACSGLTGYLLVPGRKRCPPLPLSPGSFFLPRALPA